MADSLAIAAFWASTGLVAYTYVFYPVMIRLAAKLFGRRSSAGAPSSGIPDGEPPSVSLIVAAYNEEAVIGQRVTNALEMDYPPDRFEVIVGSDGSSDRTNEIVEAFDDPRVRLLNYTDRGGKSSVLNKTAPQAKGDVLVFSDANTFFQPDAINQLVATLQRPGVSVACGRLVLVDADGAPNADSLYWHYETAIKRAEGRLGALLGANGAIYALRREHYVPLPPNTIIDDFVGPLLTRMRHGGRIVFAPNAIATEETAQDLRAEFRRRCRIGAGNFQSLGSLWPLLNPVYGWTSLAFFSHKLLRWMTPHLMIVALVASGWLAGRPLYAVLLGLQIVFFATSVLGTRLALPGFAGAAVRALAMFTSMNTALFFGFCRWLRGDLSGAWRRTARSQTAE